MAPGGASEPPGERNTNQWQWPLLTVAPDGRGSSAKRYGIAEVLMARWRLAARAGAPGGSGEWRLAAWWGPPDGDDAVMMLQARGA